jgi:hypothetical protein
MPKPLSLAALDAALTQGEFPGMSDEALQSACYSVEFAFDPLAISGHEAHRCDVDRCGLSDGRLRQIEAAAWAELAERNDRRHGMAA